MMNVSFGYSAAQSCKVRAFRVGFGPDSGIKLAICQPCPGLIRA